METKPGNKVVPKKKKRQIAKASWFINAFTEFRCCKRPQDQRVQPLT